ncbi:FkbM family methyltransferase [Helicobacter sp. 16-1353]|uniref:FkbM family methyltransferase n=1 Tax=Helicobacter sp. 16-1353 TaxID=2004996 RepID=UPI0015EED687|nr:FkbM family methyltransferase [Helicobacter sp. 16-1353]
MGGVISIDCGAHAGLVTDILLQCGSKVALFEPNEYLHSILEIKYKNNPNVLLNKVAVSNKNGTTKFLRNSTLSQGNRIDNAGDNEEIYDEYCEVKVVDLVEYVQNEILPFYKRIYFLKIDVEGAEFDIMDKIIETKLYEKIDYIACETHERYFNDGEAKIAKLRNAIKDNNIKNIFLDWI